MPLRKSQQEMMVKHELQGKLLNQNQIDPIR